MRRIEVFQAIPIAGGCLREQDHVLPLGQSLGERRIDPQDGTRAMAIDHAAQGIRVNAVAPGPTATSYFDRMLQTVRG